MATTTTQAAPGTYTVQRVVYLRDTNREDQRVLIGITNTPVVPRTANLRIPALIGWGLAIIAELVTIFWFVNLRPIDWLSLAIIVLAVGAVAVPSSLLWRQANLKAPAPGDSDRFFFQHFVGGILTVMAYPPMLGLVLQDKALTVVERVIVSALGLVVCTLTVLFGVNWG